MGKGLYSSTLQFMGHLLTFLARIVAALTVEITCLQLDIQTNICIWCLSTTIFDFALRFILTDRSNADACICRTDRLHFPTYSCQTQNIFSRSSKDCRHPSCNATIEKILPQLSPTSVNIYILATYTVHHACSSYRVRMLNAGRRDTWKVYHNVQEVGSQKWHSSWRHQHLELPFWCIESRPIVLS